MVRRVSFVLAACLLAAAGMAQAQGPLSDILSGRLIKPEVGVWAWYDLKDSATGKSFLVRHAVVDKESVGRKTGYWVELEIIPRLGFKSVYKMLLTGPASDPANVHKVLIREGYGPVTEVPLSETEEEEASEAATEAERELVGEEEVETLGGKVQAKRYEIEKAAGQEGDSPGGPVVLWVNESVRPMGIVRMTSPEGEFLLRNYGVGGENARSVIEDEPEPGYDGSMESPNLRVRVGEESESSGAEKEEP